MIPNERAERALFAHRRKLTPPPPPVSLVLARIELGAHSEPRAAILRALGPRMGAAFAALAACVAMAHGSVLSASDALGSHAKIAELAEASPFADGEHLTCHAALSVAAAPICDGPLPADDSAIASRESSVANTSSVPSLACVAE